MALTTTWPWKHPETGIDCLRRAVPLDLRVVAGRREEKISLAIKDPVEAKRPHAVALAELEQPWSNLRDDLRSLSERQPLGQPAVERPPHVVALADGCGVEQPAPRDGQGVLVAPGRGGGILTRGAVLVLSGRPEGRPLLEAASGADASSFECGLRRAFLARAGLDAGDRAGAAAMLAQARADSGLSTVGERIPLAAAMEAVLALEPRDGPARRAGDQAGGHALNTRTPPGSESGQS